MKIVTMLALSSALTAGTTAAGWLNRPDPHPVVVGLPDTGAWPAAVSAIAPGAFAPDPNSATPQQVRRFIDGRTEPQRLALADRVPGVIGNLDGVPAALRYRANARASGEPAARQLLGYDRRGDGTLIEVLGDLDAARHVAVIVPGSGWRLDNTLRDDGTAAVHPVRVAETLLTELRRLDPAARAAVVVWLGYDTPEVIDRQAVRSERAIAAAPRLARFIDGLPGDAQLSLFCHSYGAVVCGLAGPADPADDVVVLAAPGMDVGSAAELRVARRVWAARTAGDHIRLVPALRVGGYGHGADPIDPDFGAAVFRAGAAAGHDGYYQPNTESLTNIARIALGRTEEVTLAEAAAQPEPTRRAH